MDRRDATALTLPQAMQLAVAACRRGDWNEAERLCRRVLEAKSEHFDALYLLGIVAAQTGRPAEAGDLLRRALAIDPGNPDALYNRGVALGQIGQHAEALECYEQAVAHRPAFTDAHFNRGSVLRSLGRPAQAIEAYDRALALDPNAAETHHSRGVALAQLERHEEALASHERAIQLRPAYAAAHNNRGVALSALGRHAEALESYERAIALQPDFANAHGNRGIALVELDRPDEALRSCDRAIAIKPDNADAHYNRGNALRELHRHDEAEESYRRAITIEPAHASAHWNLADSLLLRGEFAEGWREYEWRWKLAPRQKGRRDFAQPLWLGDQPLSGRTILLHSELGLGDTLQFCRYATEVAALGARVLLEVQPPLVPLVSTLEGVAEVLPRGAGLPPFDYHCPLLSLPLAFRTDLATLPARIPYLRSDPHRVEAWAHALGEPRKPRVGIAWSGSQGLRNDKRSMALAEMLPLIGDWAEWISLQKDVGERDARMLASHGGIFPTGERLADFADTAAVVEILDVLVTVDTSVAHVAGAMGKPVWILLPDTAHDWRWQLGREESAWYPTARLLRQSTAGDWASVIARARDELAKRFGAR